jgi:signal transduction histidine kinase
VQRLEELDAVKTSFVQSVSHELRTPMTNVLGYTDMLLEEQFGEVNPSQRTMLQSVSRNGRRLLKLIEDLLTLSRIEQGSFTALAERIDLRDAVRRGCDAVASQAEAASVTLDVDLGEDPVPVVGDADQLERLTVNLLGNAVKFSAGGSVAVALACADGEAVLTVADQGMGIPASEVARLFDRFFRSSITQRAEVQGSGLGLAIVKGVVDHHDGRIEVESQEGVGTTLRVRLPLQATAGLLAPVSR